MFVCPVRAAVLQFVLVSRLQSADGSWATHLKQADTAVKRLLLTYRHICTYIVVVYRSVHDRLLLRHR